MSDMAWMREAIAVARNAEATGEVRALGPELGLPKMIFRHPFPGPGLAVRVIGEVRRDYVELLRKADAIYMDALHEAGLYEKTSEE